MNLADREAPDFRPLVQAGVFVVEAGMESSRINDPRTPPGAPAAGCDVVTVPARQGLEAVDILRRGPGDAVGPVLHDG
ncbi:hypothetical protein ABZ281_49340, partial [Streptomyces sp. NPDC006265]